MTRYVNAEISNGHTMQGMKWKCEQHRACQACMHDAHKMKSCIMQGEFF